MSNPLVSQFEIDSTLLSSRLTNNSRIRLLPAAFPVPLSGLWNSSVEGGIDVAMIVTNNCKSACAHCYNDSGPKGGLEISPDKLRRLIDQGEILGMPISRIGFSGGEPLLYNALPELSERSASQNIEVSCITGGVGIQSEQIFKLAESGVRRLTFSFDIYHANFVSKDRISKLANMAADLFPEVAVQISATSTREGLDLAHRLAERIKECVEIAVMPVTGIGRAMRLSGTKLSKPETEDSRLFAESAAFSKKVTINFDEWVYANCRLDGFRNDTRLCRLDDLFNSDTFIDFSNYP